MLTIHFNEVDHCVMFGICWVRLLGIIFLTANFNVFSFQLNRSSHSNGRASHILMGKRSLEDQKFSKKQLFRRLRHQLEEAAKDPTFFEDEKAKPVRNVLLSQTLSNFIFRRLSCFARVPKMESK